ncbi:MAG: hypothetical protein AAFU03_13265, partial [Bacteroidota bacterium]
MFRLLFLMGILPSFFTHIDAQVISPSTNKVVQTALVREQNSGRKVLANTFVSFEDAVPTTSAEDGSFRLVFKSKKPGQWAFLQEVRKVGYELVNEKELDQVKISDTEAFGVDIILAPAGTVEAAKREYYGVSDSALVANFNREKRILRRKLAAAELLQTQYDDSLRILQEQFDEQQQNLDALATLCVRQRE